jgi:thiamine-phosphate pyrophosphorylase
MLMASSLSRAKLARAALFHNSGVLALLTDDLRLADPLASVQALPTGSLVIVRAHDHVRRAVLAAQLRPIVRRRGLILLIADDPHLAARIGAHGIHLSERRAKEAAHWRARFGHWFVTAAAHSLRAVLNAAAADAVLLSPVFATQSHAKALPLTPARARLMARQIRTPIFALGGVTANNAALLPGFAGLAAIGALTKEACAN